MFTEAALVRAVDPSTLARECSLIGLTVLSTAPVMEAYVRHLSGIQRPEVVTRASHANGKGASE
jgi:hypothetical protein